MSEPKMPSPAPDRSRGPGTAAAAAALAAVLSATAAAALASLLAAGPARAVEPLPIQECPPEHRLAEPRILSAPPDEGTVREVLTHVPIGGWRGVEGLALRIRRLTVVPGGWVPLHWHDDRPSVDYVIAGELVEHNSFCAVPIVHRPGASSNRFGAGLSHWWVNETADPVVLISADVVPVESVAY